MKIGGHQVDREEEILITTAELAAWLYSFKKRGWSAMISTWPKDLWSKPNEDIMEFLDERRNRTTNMIEYYCTLPYLMGYTPFNDLCIPFHIKNSKRNNLPRTDNTQGKEREVRVRGTIGRGKGVKVLGR